MILDEKGKWLLIPGSWSLREVVSENCAC